MSQITNHSEYFIPGGDLFIQVEDVLFRVHSYFFERESSRYRNEVSAPFAPGVARLGSSLSNPLKILNSSPQEFSKFLWVFYNRHYSTYKATSAEWISILKIACEYDFPEVKALAIRGIQKGGNLTIFRLIYIYQLYKVDISYLIPLYIILCKRDKAPTDSEAKELGAETTILIFRLREAVRSSADDTCKSPLPSNLDDEDLMSTICSYLGVDHTIGGSSRKRSPIVRSSLQLPQRMSRSPEAVPRRRTSSMQETTSHREAFILDQVVCPPGPEGCRFAAEEDNVVDKTPFGRFENKKNLLSYARAPLSFNFFLRVTNNMVVARSNGTVVVIFLVMRVRTIIFLVALMWTIGFFLVCRAVPTDILLF